MVILILLLVIFAVFMIFTGVLQIARAPGDPISERISRIAHRTPLERAMLDGIRQTRDVAEEEEARARARRREWLPTVSRILSGHFWFERLDAELVAARSPWKATEILAASASVYLMAGASIALAFGRMIGFVVGLPALAIPWVLVKFFQAQFIRRFEVQLADTLTMMANALRGGYSYMQSIELVARESIPPMGDEFRVMLQEMSVGITPEQSLINFSDRVRSPDVELMVTAMIIQRRVGGALAEILNNIAEVIRERVRLRGQIRTLTAQGRLTGYMLACLPIGIGVVVNVVTTFFTGESYMKPMLDKNISPWGPWLIMIALSMQIMGFLTIKRITSIEV